WIAANFAFWSSVSEIVSGNLYMPAGAAAAFSSFFLPAALSALGAAESDRARPPTRAAVSSERSAVFIGTSSPGGGNQKAVQQGFRKVIASGCGRVCRSREERFDRLAVADDRDGSAGTCVVLLGEIDAEVGVEGCRDVVGAEAFVRRSAGGLVAFADDLSAADTAAGHQH